MRFTKSAGSLLFYIIIIVLGCGIGSWIGISVSERYLMEWDHKTLSDTPNDIKYIIFVDFQLASSNYSDDMVLVKTSDGELYSLHQNKWQIISPIPFDSESVIITKLNGNILAISKEGTSFQLSNNQWFQQSDIREDIPIKEQFECASGGRNSPPVSQQVLDSNGMILNHALSKSVRCYVLQNDGSLHIWVQNDSAFESLPIVAISAFLGMIASLWIIVYISIDKK